MASVAVALSACSRGPIRTPHPITFEDDAITARVKTALLNDQEIGVMKIDVATSNGVVTLSGTVGSKNDEARAVALAQRAEGVKRVVSRISVIQSFSLRPFLHTNPRWRDAEIGQQRPHLVDERRRSTHETQG